MSDIFEIPMVISKDDIAVLGATKNCVNAHAVRIVPTGDTFEPTCLIWLGFAGKCNLETYQWEGAGKFQEIPSGSINTRADFANVINCCVPLTAASTVSVVDNDGGAE